MKCERMMSLNGIVVSVISSYTCTCVYIINDFVIHTPVTVSRNSTGISYASSFFFFLQLGNASSCRAVVNTVANKPQSQSFGCFCTLAYFSVISLSLVLRREVICFFCGIWEWVVQAIIPSHSRMLSANSAHYHPVVTSWMKDLDWFITSNKGGSRISYDTGVY